MSRRQVPLVLGAAVILLLLVWYGLLWRPVVANSTKANASRATAQALQVTLEGRLAGLRTLQKTLPSAEAKLRQGQVAVPTSVSIDTLIDQINAIAVADQIAWTNESQAADAAAASSSTAVASTSSTTVASSTTGDSTLTLSLQVAGSYIDMTRFITDLGHRPRLIVIDTLAYSPGANSAVSVSMTARAFYNPTADPTIPAGS